MTTFKRIITLILICGWACESVVLAQNRLQSKIESVTKEIQRTPATSDSLLAELKWKLTGYYWEVYPDSAITYALSALNHAQALQYPEMTAQAYHMLGSSYETLSNYDSAIYYLTKSITIREAIKSKRTAFPYINLGVVHKKLQDYEKALEAYAKAKTLLQKQGDQRNLTAILNNMGVVYEKMNLPDSSLKYYSEALGIRISLKDSIGIGRSLGNVGYAYFTKKMYQESYDYQHKSLMLNERFGKERSVALNHINLAELLFIARGPVDSAYYHINRAIYLAKKIHLSERLLEALEMKSQIDIRAGNYKSAVSNLIQYNAKKDSLFTRERAESISRYETLYESEKKQRKIDELIKIQTINELKAKQHNILLLLILIICAILLVFALLMRKQSLLRKHTNQRLNQQKEEISTQNQVVKKALRDKELLVREIQHRTKNNLVMVRNLLRYESRNTRNGEARSIIDESQHKLNAITLLHDQLYSSGENDTIQIKDYLDNLISSLQKATLPDQAIHFKVDLDDMSIGVHQSVPIGLIVNEAITNAIKYAFEISNNPINEIQISFKRMSNRTSCILEIKDNGTGFQPGNGTTGATGLTLMDGLAKQLKSELRIDTNEGTHLILEVPIEAYEMINK